jgi:hypothetical protein
VAPIPIGTIVEGEVVAHRPFGLEFLIRSTDPPVVGIVDVAYIVDDQQISGPADFPPVGRVMTAVVTACTPSGQLRLSTRQSFIDRVRAGEWPEG